MGIIAGVLVTGGYLKTFDIPLWVILSAHAAIALGTLSGGWRIVHTMGQRMTRLQPVGGFAAETSGAITLFLASKLGIPVSHHPHHHRRHRRRRRHAAAVGGALGRGRPHRLGVGAHHPLLGGDRRDHLPAGAPADPLSWRRLNTSYRTSYRTFGGSHSSPPGSCISQ